MALAFFRRRQKMVVIIMAVLMVSFLIGFQGFSMLFNRDRSETAYGRTEEGEITYRQLDQARSDIQALIRYVGLGNPYRSPAGELSRQMLGMDVEMNLLRRNGEDDERLAYVLLLQEAEAAGVSVSNSEVDRFLKDIGLSGEHYSNRIAEIRDEPGITEKQFRSWVAKWLTIHKTFARANVDSPPSSQEILRIYRDTTEQIKLRVLRISADDLVKNVTKKFSEQEINEHFKRYRGAVAGQYPTTDSFGIGYRVPHRLAIEYLMTDQTAIRRVTKLSKKVIRKYCRDNKEQFVKQIKVPITPATQPTSGPATAPAIGETRTKTVPMGLLEAMASAQSLLTDELIDKRMDNTINYATAVLANIISDEETKTQKLREVYKQVKAKMVRTELAEKVLSRKLDVEKLQKIKAMPLDEAMKVLADAANLEAICYPWGKHGDFELSKDVLVTLTPSTPITLEEALERITQEVFGPSATTKEKLMESPTTTPATRPSSAPAGPPRLKWAMCAGFNDILFPYGGDIEMFPISVRKTSLLSRKELKNYAPLSQCYTAQRGGKNLVNLAFMAKEFLPLKNQDSAAIGAGKDGPQMFMMGKKKGRLLWRLTEVIPAHQPDKITNELHAKIIEDLRIKAAFAKAEKIAEKYRVEADKKGLQAVAKNSKLETFETDFFTRRTRFSPQMQMIRYAAMTGQLTMQAWMQAFMLQPYAYPYGRIEGISLPTGQHGEYFMGRAFSLVPEDIEKPSDASKSPVVIFPSPSQREILVLERADYKPALIDEYKKRIRSDLLKELLENRRWAARMQWFAVGNIKNRTGFVIERGDS